MKKAKIAVLVSGGGTNLQALLDAQAAVKSVENAVTLPVPRWEMMRALFMLEVIVAREQRMLTALWDASGTPSSR